VPSTALSLSRDKRHVAPFTGPAWYVAAGWLFAAAVLQTTFGHVLSIRGAVPSFILVAVVWYAIRVDALRAAAYGLAAGLLEDALAATTGAAWTVSTLVTAVAISLSSRGFFADSIPLAAVVTALATLLRALLFWTIASLEGYPPGLATLHFHQALFASVLNVCTTIAAMLLMRRYEALRS
jgi:rod shape-determining protein MreD